MNNVKKSKPLRIALLGPYRPPYGGISIHIQRLKQQLEKRGYKCVVYDLRREEELPEKNAIAVKNTKRWLPKYFFFAKENIIHYHNSGWQMSVIIGLMGLLGKKRLSQFMGRI